MKSIELVWHEVGEVELIVRGRLDKQGIEIIEQFVLNRMLLFKEFILNLVEIDYLDFAGIKSIENIKATAIRQGTRMTMTNESHIVYSVLPFLQ